MDNINSSPEVSVIIPVYNVEQYLRQCLDSVCNQTFKDIEIIVVNDCSPDNSLQIIKEYQQKDKRIVLVDLKQNGGLGNARNQGMKIAKGKYLTFVDSDDFISNNCIEVLYNNIEKLNTNFIGSEFLHYNANTHKISDGIIFFNKYNTVINDIHTKKTILQRLAICRPWGILFSRHFLQSKNIFFKIRRHEDILFMYEVFIKAYNFAFISDKTYYYRCSRPGSIMNTNTIDDRFILYKNLKLLNETSELKEYIREFYKFISIDFAMHMENNIKTYKQAKQYFIQFRDLFYDKNYIINFSDLTIRKKIRLFVFKFCLKYNLNYYYIGKIHNKFNPIRLLTHKRYY